jgi:hypothetical protein
MLLNINVQSWSLKRLRILSTKQCSLALLISLMVSGCETLDRMDYLDQVFDPAGYSERHKKPEQRSNLPSHVVLPASPTIEQQPTLEAASVQNSSQQNIQSAPPRHGIVQSRDFLPSSSLQAQQSDTTWVRDTVRQNNWLMRDWAQLTPSQQMRVERQLENGKVTFTTEYTEPASIWDTLGLPDRAALAFKDPSIFVQSTRQN